MRRLFQILLSAMLVVSSSFVHAQETEPRIQDVLGSVTFDFNGDGGFDRALLVQADGVADLYIYSTVQDPQTKDDKLNLFLKKKEIAFSGPLWGQLPSIEVSGKGSLRIKSENSAIGRNRWTQVLTLAYREERFVVLGITYTSYDTLDPNSFTDCDLNLVTGRGVRKGKAITLPLKPIPLVDWSDDKIPSVCTN